MVKMVIIICQVILCMFVQQIITLFVLYICVTSFLFNHVLSGIFYLLSSACSSEYRHYCFNGGTCYHIPDLDLNKCNCKVEGNIAYKGERCEQMERINQEN